MIYLWLTIYSQNLLKPDTAVSLRVYTLQNANHSIPAEFALKLWLLCFTSVKCFFSSSIFRELNQVCKFLFVDPPHVMHGQKTVDQWTDRSVMNKYVEHASQGSTSLLLIWQSIHCDIYQPVVWKKTFIHNGYTFLAIVSIQQLYTKLELFRLTAGNMDGH